MTNEKILDLWKPWEEVQAFEVTFYVEKRVPARRVHAINKWVVMCKKVCVRKCHCLTVDQVFEPGKIIIDPVDSARLKKDAEALAVKWAKHYETEKRRLLALKGIVQ